jgi:DNA-binding MarR family transcriptional regulator
MRELLSAALQEECGLSISEFEVLIMVNNTDTSSLRISALAERVLLSPSGVSRLVDRLERRGLVVRSKDDDGDRRSMRVTITDEGRELFQVASRAHSRRVRALFLDKMTQREMETLAGVWEKLSDS